MEKDYEKLFAVKYVLQKEGLENFRRNRKHITEFENVFFEVVSKEPRPIRKYKISSNRTHPPPTESGDPAPGSGIPPGGAAGGRSGPPA